MLRQDDYQLYTCSHPRLFPENSLVSLLQALGVLD